MHQIQVQRQGRALYYSESEIRKEIQNGYISGSDRLYYVPWTGKRWMLIKEIDQLERDRQTPTAIMVARIEQNAFPWLSIMMGLGLLIGFVFQHQDSYWIQQNASGWGNFMLEENWWVLLVSVFLHQSPSHLLSNAILLFYSSYRVERACGWRILLLVYLYAALFSNFLVILGGEFLVIGASSLVFGVWVTQIGIGLYIPLPEEHRAPYGWGNLLLFVPMYALNVIAVGVSHLAHLGGILAGGMISSWVPLKPRTEKRAYGGIVVFGTLFCSLCLSPSLSTPFLYEYGLDGMKVQLPIAFQRVRHPSNPNVQLWSYASNVRSYVLAQGSWDIQEHDAAWWDAYWGKGTRLKNRKQDGKVVLSKLEKGSLSVLQKEWFEGDFRSWMACVYESPSWERHCEWWFSLVDRDIPIRLQKSRERFESRPDIAYFRSAYAEDLKCFGQYKEADSLLIELQNKGGFERRSMLGRMKMRLEGKLPLKDSDQTWLRSLGDLDSEGEQMRTLLLHRLSEKELR
ncbi:MAG: rhomboid family intramembrane serine protease [Myxococcota bacterium]|nr:rhomboid family intramembrane serine protease [Myxococcota bacterium]